MPWGGSVLGFAGRSESAGSKLARAILGSTVAAKSRVKRISGAVFCKVTPLGCMGLFA